MKIKFIGAAKEVTGSKHLITTDHGKKILLDCGMFQGKGLETDAANRNTMVDPKDVDYIILTHAHIDHCGLIPYFYKKGFRGQVVCTDATRDLCNIMLPDSGFIQENDMEWFNKKRRRQGLPALEPIYTEQDARASMSLFLSVAYNRYVYLDNNIKVKFNNTGHLLGSGCAILEIDEGGNMTRIAYTGDIGREYRYYHKDIEVHDLSSCGDTIHINGNTVINRNLVLTDHDDSGYMFLQTRGGIVSVLGNHLLNEVTVNPKNRKPYGMRLIWCQYEGGNVTLRDNVCKGLESVAYVGGGEGTDLFTLNAINNVFEGDTRIYSHKIKKMNLNFKGNTFRSSNMNFFLVEFAPSGSVVFDNNDVTVNGGNGQFMTHWSKSSTKNYRFDRLEVKYNVFHGVANEKELLKNVTNARKRKIGHNRYNR